VVEEGRKRAGRRGQEGSEGAPGDHRLGGSTLMTISPLRALPNWRRTSSS
jgi:hypothetical protein